MKLTFNPSEKQRIEIVKNRLLRVNKQALKLTTFKGRYKHGNYLFIKCYYVWLDCNECKKMTKKQKDRQIIFDKFQGKCAYCGTELIKGWHVDEIQPVRRNKDGTCLFPENFNLDNQNPACPSCNINKHSMSLEMYRQLIEGFTTSLKLTVQYRFALKYGLVEETNNPVTFYFEKI